MSEKKGRPESRQKKTGADTEDGILSSGSRKKSVSTQKSSTKWADGLKRVKSAKSSKSMITDEKSALSLNKVERKKSSQGRVKDDKSALNLNKVQRKKSSQGREKMIDEQSELSLNEVERMGCSQWSERMTGDTKTVRKFIGKCKPEKTEAEDDEEEEEEEKTGLRNGKIWDKDIEKLALRKKRVSLIDKEIGVKQIRIIPVTPLIETVVVKKKAEKEQNEQCALVMKVASPDAELMQPDYKGPRYDPLGKIIPHSILGDVESFLKHSGQLTKVSNILLVHPETPTVRTVPDETCSMYDPLMNQGNALETWKNEMVMRYQEQNRLAGILNRKESELLMCKSETKADRELVNILQYDDSRYDPNVCFWRVSQQCTAGQLQETLTKSNRGQLPTPVLSGDADTVLREKSKIGDAELCKRLKDETAQEKVESVKGTIQIANKVLFNKLLLQGEGIASKDSARGDNIKEVKFRSENEIYGTGNEKTADVPSKFGAVFSSFFGARRMSKIVRETRELMKFKGASAEPEYDEYACYNRSERRGTLHKDLVLSEQLARAGKDNRRLLDFRFIGLEKEEIDGPALLIDGTTLQWCDSSEDNGYHSNNILMEVFVLIKCEAGEMTRGYAKMENVGTTTVRYSWQRVPENKTLPVPRPRRRFFYFLDDEGVVLPRETVYVPMLFKSSIPGYFTESWLMSTIPLLEGGAKVKYTFKAIARYEPDFSRQFQEIEEYLKKKQTDTLCSVQTKSIEDYALLKASLEHRRLRYDPIEQSIEEVFMQTNPGLYYYAHVIKRLQLLCKSFIPETEHRKLENGILVVSVSGLWKAYLALPDDDAEDDSDSEDESYINLTRKQTLLWQLYKDIATLAFQPVVVLQSSFQSKYIMTYTMLQTGIDHVVSFARRLAKGLRLVRRKRVKKPDNTQKQGKENKNKGKEKEKVASNSPKGGKKGKTPEEAPPVVEIPTSPVVPKLVFSAAENFRKGTGNKFSPMLTQYDEKVYLEMYSMLINTVEEMSVLFEAM